MYYSEDLVEEVRMKNDIVDIISGYVKLQRKGSSYFGLCPFHNEKSPSFSVSPAKQMYYCFGCGAGGNVFSFIMEYENYTFPEALKSLAERSGVELPEVEYSQEAKKQADIKHSILEINKLAAKYFYYQLRSENGRQAYAYLSGRELSDDTIKKFGLGFANKYSDDLYKYLKQQGYSDELLKDSGLVNVDEAKGIYDKFWNRVIFPIMDVNNRVIGFGGRVMGEGMPKYLNSPETKIFDKSRNLYGLNIARTSRKPYILVCEGYMDVIALHQAGFQNAVASLGTAFTTGHAGLLKRYTDEVLLTYDSDEAGAKAALRAIPICKEAGLSAKVINMKPYKDPDEFIKNLGAEAFEQRIKESVNSFFYEIGVLEEGYNLKDPEEKTQFYNEIAKKLLNFKEEIERENYIEAVAERYHISFESLRKLVRQLGLKMGGMPEIKKVKSNAGKEKEDGTKQSQKLMLTWLIEDNSLYQKVKNYITPDDFTEELYKKVAKMVYEQFEAGEANPAKIINYFTDEEEHREIAALFNARLNDVETKAEKEKALLDTILRMKADSIEHESRMLDITDIEGFQKIIAKRKAWDEEKRKLHISLE